MSVRDEIFAFLATQPAWQQDLARRLLQVGTLADWEFEEVLNLVKEEHGCAPEGARIPAAQPLSIDELPAPDKTGSARLTSFGGLRGVGAVGKSYKLSFAPHGLTVVYGGNAAGKSTYVRGLKAICRSVHGTPLLQGDVFAAQPPSAERLADIELHAGTSGAPVSLSDVDLTAPPEYLGTRNIAVFDSACASLYLSRSNRVEFVPSELRVLERLCQTQKAMRERVRGETEAIKRELPVFNEISLGTSAAEFVVALHPNTRGTDPGMLWRQAQALATLSDEESGTLAELRAVLAAQASANGKKDAAAARGDATGARDLADRLEDLADRVSARSAGELSRLSAKAREVEEALSLAAEQFANQSLEGVGSAGAWQHLWSAARSFSTAHAHPFPPAQGQPCPLCLQPLAEAAAQRMGDFERHVRSQLADHQKQATAQLQSALGRIDPQQTGHARTQFLDGLREREPELHEQAIALVAAIEERMAALRQDHHTAPQIIGSRQVVDSLRQWATGREQHAERVLAAQDPASEQRLQAQLTELEARTRLHPRLLDINRWLHRVVLIKALRQTWKSLDHTRVSNLQGKLSKETVTVDFRRVLDEERKALHVDRLAVDVQPQTQAGTTLVSVALANTHSKVKVETVVSEGEHRALALAFFFAELRMSKGDGGIVLDDPCSSLDDQRRTAIVQRLVELAKERQVIVFTHDLGLLSELYERAPKRGVNTHFQHVWRRGPEVGRADGDPPFSLMSATDRAKALRKDLSVWEDGVDRSNDEEWRRVDNFYERLREAWERGIEHSLFNGVVGRLQKGVKTDNVKDVFIDDALRHAVDDGMTQSSRFVHDASERAIIPLPEPTDLDADLTRLEDFLKLVKTVRKDGKAVRPTAAPLASAGGASV